MLPRFGSSWVTWPASVCSNKAAGCITIMMVTCAWTRRISGAFKSLLKTPPDPRSCFCLGSTWCAPPWHSLFVQGVLHLKSRWRTADKSCHSERLLSLEILATSTMSRFFIFLFFFLQPHRISHALETCLVAWFTNGHEMHVKTAGKKGRRIARDSITGERCCAEEKRHCSSCLTLSSSTLSTQSGEYVSACGPVSQLKQI